MPDRDQPLQDRRGEPSSSDSAEKFHGLLASRSPIRRKKVTPGAAEPRAVRVVRHLVTLVNFLGGGLVGSGLTLLREGRSPLGSPAVLVASGLIAAVVALLFLQLMRFRFAATPPGLGGASA